MIYQDLSLFPNLSVAENIAVGAASGAAACWSNGRAIHDAAAGRHGAHRRLARSLRQGRRSRSPAASSWRSAAPWRLTPGSSSWTSRPLRSRGTRSMRCCGSSPNSRQRDICMVFVSHRLDEVLEVAERVTVLRDGDKLGTFNAREMDDRKLAHLMTGKAFALRDGRSRFLRSAETVLSRRRASRAPAIIADVNLRHACRRDSRPDRPARFRPHRTRAFAVRHESAGIRRNPASPADDRAAVTNRAGDRAKASPTSRRTGSLSAWCWSSRSPPTSWSRCSTSLLGRLRLVDRSERAAAARRLDRGPRNQGRRIPKSRSRRCPAATSSAWCWPNGWRRSRRLLDSRQPDRRRRHRRQGRHLRDRQALAASGVARSLDLRRNP